MDSNHRSLRRQIYSLIHLAALESVRIWCSASCGAGDWTWTHNLLITNQLLCQLSYTGMWCLEVESNHRQRDFQSLALPTELSRHWFFGLSAEKRVKKWRPKRGSNSWPPAWQAGALTKLSYWALPFKAHQRMLDYNNLFSHICQAFFSFFAQIFKKFSEHFSRRFLSFLSV